MGLDEIIELIRRVKGDLDTSSITLDSNLVSDLSLSSMQLVSFIVLCESEYEVELLSDPELLSKIFTLRDAMNLISEQAVSCRLL